MMRKARGFYTNTYTHVEHSAILLNFNSCNNTFLLPSINTYLAVLPTLATTWSRKKSTRRLQTSTTQVISPNIVTYTRSTVYILYVGCSNIWLHNTAGGIVFDLFLKGERSKFLQNLEHHQNWISPYLAHYYFLKIYLKSKSHRSWYGLVCNGAVIC